MDKGRLRGRFTYHLLLQHRNSTWCGLKGSFIIVTDTQAFTACRNCTRSLNEG
jgi:hypothetical protein